jgi:peroxiredoxin (alkyl hydroperoxide reductase subunit C)
VISPEGRVIYAYSSLDPDKHVENIMAALEKWRAEHKS